MRVNRIGKLFCVRSLNGSRAGFDTEVKNANVRFQSGALDAQQHGEMAIRTSRKSTIRRASGLTKWGGQTRRFFIALSVVLAAYWAYARWAVPWIEGPSHRTRSPLLASLDIVSHEPNLAAWFPTDAWELQSCKRLDTATGHILFQDYMPYDDGRVEVHPLTIIYFEASDSQQQTPIILRAPQGAILKFDRPLSLGGKSGQLESGMLHGPVEILRRESAPGKRDSWRIVTSEIQLNNQRVQTLQDVDFEFGDNRGHGRHLIMELERNPLHGGQKTMAGVRGASRIELVQISQLRLVAQQKPASVADATLTPLPNPDAATLYDVTCSGPLEVDLHRNIASLSDDVLVVDAANSHDWMRADRIELGFAGHLSSASPVAETPAASVDAASTVPDEWTLQRITAIGKPAQISFQSRKLAATGEQLTYDLSNRRVRIVNSAGMPLRQGPYELTVTDLEYQLLQDGTMGPTTIRGPGRLIRTEDEPSQSLDVRWQDGLVIGADGALKTMTIAGAVRARLDQQSELDSDQVVIWFTQAPKPSERQAAGAEMMGGVLHPNKLLATGNVHITSDRLDVHVNQLEAYWPDAQPISELQITAARSTYVSAIASSPENQPRPASTNAATLQQPSAASDSSRGGFDVRHKSSGIPIFVRGNLAEVYFKYAANSPGANGHTSRPADDFNQGDRQAAAAKERDHDATSQIKLIKIDGNVIVEQPDKSESKKAFRINGSELDVIPQDASHNRIAVRGNPQQPAQVHTAQMVLVGNSVDLDQAANRLWISGPGRMQTQPSDQTDGNRGPRTIGNLNLKDNLQIDVQWRGGMVFDGQQVYFETAVETDIVQSRDNDRAKTHVSCAAVNLSLDRAIDLAGESNRSTNSNALVPMEEPKIELLTIVGSLSPEKLVFKAATGSTLSTAEPSDAVLTRQTFDSQMTPSSWQRLSVPWAQINMASGDTKANGPGVVSIWQTAEDLSVRRQAKPSSPAAKNNALTNTQVKFDDSITGNLHQSDFLFNGNVRVIHGPVADTRQELDADRSPLATGRYRLKAQQVRLTQWQKSSEQRPHVEIVATGQLQIDGELFDALAQRLSFDQSRDTVVLEGDARNHAQLNYQTGPDAPRNPLVAAKITYKLSDNTAEAEGIKHGVFSTGPILKR